MTRLSNFLNALGPVDCNPMKKKGLQQFPFKQILPAKLRDYVAKRSDKQKGASCLQEMSLMLACLKDGEFDDKRCAKEIEGFLACNEKFQKQMKNKGQLKAEELKESGRLPSNVLNDVLSKYPQQKKKT